MRRVGRVLAAILCCVALEGRADSARPSTVVDLIPDDRAPVGMRTFFAPLTSLFLGPGYWYGERTIRIETTPPGAELDLFYVRANFQKRFERSESPVTIRLPRRIEAGPRDAVTIRAFVEGLKIREVSVPVGSREDAVTLELDPLDNRLESVAYTHFAGRGTLALSTKTAPQVRVQERAGGFTIVLNQTAKTAEAVASAESVRSALIASASAQQLGEDLLLRVDWTPEAAREKIELRSRTSIDPARGLHVFSIDFARVNGDAASDPQAQMMAAMARVSGPDVSGCALSFDATLREALDAAALARALAPRGGLVDPILRAGMRRLGELSSGGRVTLEDGTQWMPSVPLELEAALAQAGNVKGYLALLRKFCVALDGANANDSLRGIVAPELPDAQFAVLLERASAAERECRKR